MGYDSIIEDDKYYSTGMNETKDELAIIIYRCYFLANQADNTIISLFGSNLNVIETIFSRNKVLGSIVKIENGVISISHSCFEKNVMSNSVMLINPQTLMGNFITNYCYENVKPNAVESDTSNMCNGILTDNECLPFLSSTCIIQTYLSLPILIETSMLSDIPTTVTVLTTPPTVTVLTAIPTTGTIVSVPGNKPM